jgi:hypothetical protein
MNSIKATWINGQILPCEPVAWLDGTELLVEPVAASPPCGLPEDQWRTDAAALAEWESWLNSLEPRVLTDEERAEFARYDEEHRRFNLEAVRQQMALGDGE